MPKQIAADSTIESVWPHLVNQRAYVSGILRTMKQCEQAHGNAFVRIGVTGTGQYPYYRVFFNDAVSQQEAVFGSYYDSHLSLQTANVSSPNWSSRHMSVNEVEDFLSEKIGWKGKGV